MQKLEPTGQARLEHYLARIVSVLKAGLLGYDEDWRENLIGWEPTVATDEQILQAFSNLDRRLGKNGDDPEPRRKSNCQN